MKNIRPGILSVRAINQYRRRDVLSYLGLRYYLDNVAARTDKWAQRIATNLVLGRTDLPYLLVHHFKETNGLDGVDYRDIYLPGANEALTEAALMDACSTHQDAFGNPSCVFSYRLNRGDDRRGIFVPYIIGLRERHDNIVAACDAISDGIVLFIDIKRFYPSISSALALAAWRRHAERANLASYLRDVGEKLLVDHAEAGKKNGHGILTGPMLSHLIGNLVLSEFDAVCSQKLPVKYIRYVDDIALIGKKDAVRRSMLEVKSRLEELGFRLHDEASPKTIQVSIPEWLTSRNDFHDSRSEISWKTLIGDLKRFLLLMPEGRNSLKQAFNDLGFRIPVLDYSNAIYEGTYLERVADLAKRAWYRRKSQTVTIESLLVQARSLRTRYREEFVALADGMGAANPYQRKRRIPKLRYRAGRLIYLSTEDTLNDLSFTAKEIPELYFHGHVMQAVATGNVDGVMSIGTNAAQAAAQPLKVSGKTAYGSRAELTDIEGQSLAVFLYNGIQVERPVAARLVETGLMDMARAGASISLMKRAEPFVREMACLHGIADKPRHPAILESVFDQDEELSLDAIDQLQQSVSP